MNKRFSTIVFVPHAYAKFRKVRISHRTLYFFAAVGTVSLALSLFFTIHYFTSLSRSHELSQLRTENHELQQANEQFSRSVETLRDQLSQVEDRTRKLAIIAGINTVDDSSLGGVGGIQSDEIEAIPYGDEIDKMNFRSRRIENDLFRLEQRLTDRYNALSSTPSIAPVRGILTDGFGGRSDPFTGQPGKHNGVDISTAAGRPIRAPADGVVAKAEWANGYGNVIFLSHGYGYSTRFGHLTRFNVRAGQKVKRGDIVGFVGSTGRSTGPHLHYEVRVGGKPVNPLEYVLDAF